MIIKRLQLRNYRNYENLDILLSEGLNIFVGNNAQGKSNILESIYVLGLTKSYINVKEQYLIKNKENFAVIKASCFNKNIENNLEVIITENERKLKVNGIEFRQISTKYVKLLKNYNAVLKKRNQFLKSINCSNDNEYNRFYFDILNERFCSLAVDIMLERINFLEVVNKFLANIYFEITGYDNLVLKYIMTVEKINSRDELLKCFKSKLNSIFEREKFTGMTLIGPHRDDFLFLLDDKKLSIYGSQGQIRAAILALKLSEVLIFKEETGDYPILLLDDIFSELDIEKRNKLLKYILDDVQTIITTTDINLIDKSLVEKSKVFVVDDGKIINDGKKECKDE